MRPAWNKLALYLFLTSPDRQWSSLYSPAVFFSFSFSLFFKCWNDIVTRSRDEVNFASFLRTCRRLPITHQMGALKAQCESPICASCIAMCLFFINVRWREGGKAWGGTGENSPGVTPGGGLWPESQWGMGSISSPAVFSPSCPGSTEHHPSIHPSIHPCRGLSESRRCPWCWTRSVGWPAWS